MIGSLGIKWAGSWNLQKGEQVKEYQNYSKELKELFPSDSFQCHGYFAAALEAESKGDKAGAELKLKWAIEAEEKANESNG